MAVDDPGAVEVRCPNGLLQFKVIDGHLLEFKCRSHICTGGGSVVLHRYSIDGDQVRFVETLRFKDPVIRGRGARNRKDPQQNGRFSR